MTNTSKHPDRTHLFISYADEDVAMATWLARKLALLGYAIWFDRLKMLGGEPWPQHIDDAIKNRTFRMLALLSVHSIPKDNPVKERTLAFKISRDDQIPDFLIPLKLDKADLDWQTTNISYIPFERSWADGLRQLIKKLETIGAPRTLSNAAEAVIASLSNGEDLVSQAPETLRANAIRVQRVPDTLLPYALPSLTVEQHGMLDAQWPHYRVSDTLALAFAPPPSALTETARPHPERYRWAENKTVCSIKSHDIVRKLISRTLEIRISQTGFLKHPEKPIYYLPSTFTSNGWLTYSNYLGKKTRMKIRGKATFFRVGKPKEINYHHFAFRLTLSRSLRPSFWFQVTPTLFFFDENGLPIIDKRLGPRRRKLTKNWWNAAWINRLLVIEQLLQSLPTETALGVNLEKAFLSLSAPNSINESALESVPEKEDEDVDVHLPEGDDEGFDGLPDE